MEDNLFATLSYLNQHYGPPGLFDIIYYTLVKTEIVPCSYSSASGGR